MYSPRQLQEIIGNAIAGTIYPAHLPELYEPISYIMNLGGKRLRPCLVLMGCNLFRDETDDAIPPALAVELFHNFTLMHDDIMDRAPLRRGAATVHEKWDANTAILSGDAMLVEAYRQLAQVKPSVLESVLTIFSRTAGQVCEGQQLDMNFEEQDEVTIDAYLQMIELKTAVLLGASLEIGAITGGAGQDDATALFEFGKLLGITFQLQDDYLDLYGIPEKFGKQVGGDILANKKTYLMIKALELAGAADSELLTDLMRSSSPNSADVNPVEKISRVRAVFDRLGIPERVKAETASFTEQAFACLDRVNTAAERKKVLREFAARLLRRER